MVARLAGILHTTAAIQAFCDFGVQLLGYISEATQDRNGSRVDTGDSFVDTATAQLIIVEKELRETQYPSKSDAVQSGAEEELLENLRSSCVAVTKALFIRLRQWRDQSQDQRQWSKEDAETLETRLISFRETLQTPITHWLL